MNKEYSTTFEWIKICYDVGIYNDMDVFDLVNEDISFDEFCEITGIAIEDFV